MDNYLSFNGRSSLDFGITISGSGTYKKPARIVERFKIPGRNGELTVSDGSFENVDITYPCFIFGNFPARMDWLSSWLLSGAGYYRLEDTYHPEHFRLAQFIGGINPEPTTLNRHGRFELTFNCKPQKFLKSGELWHSVPSDKRFVNPTGFIMKPLIEIAGDGIRSLTVNDTVVNVGAVPGTDTGVTYNNMYLDCDTWEAYDDEGNNMNQYVELKNEKYPELLPGDNTVILKNRWNDDITAGAIRIMPRWWVI